TQPHHPGVEIDVVLRLGRDRSDVVDALELHRRSLLTPGLSSVSVNVKGSNGIVAGSIVSCARRRPIRTPHGPSGVRGTWKRPRRKRPRHLENVTTSPSGAKDVQISTAHLIMWTSLAPAGTFATFSTPASEQVLPR